MNTDNQNNLEQAIKLIESSSRILLVSHKRPDGDTIGASAAFHLALGQLKKYSVCACIDEISSRLRFIPASDRFVKEFDMNQFDLIIISDAGASHMTGFHDVYPDFLSKRIPILNIDHHISNESFGTVNIVDPKASSATMIVWRILKKLPIEITKDIALALLAGIYNDTGGLMHSNTTQETFETASELFSYGVSVNEIVVPMFKQSTPNQLRLWGYILENMKKNDKQILTSVVTESDFKTIGAHSSDTGGIIDLMNTVPDTSFSMLIAEDDGSVKGSLRTQKEDVNVSDIASQFGGGGHKKAAGFRFHGRLEKETIWRIVPTGE